MQFCKNLNNVANLLFLKYLINHFFYKIKKLKLKIYNTITKSREKLIGKFDELNFYHNKLKMYSLHTIKWFL